MVVPRKNNSGTCINFSDDEDDDSSVFSLWDSDSELNLNGSTDVDSNVDIKAEEISKEPKKQTVQMKEFKLDLYVIVDVVFNENTKKEDTKQLFYAVVLEISLCLVKRK